ncbi:YIP1 family protein [Viridibacillus sp. YIM B01967]|uniref:YIP1 family protein n=1 Tax=Viridibacillus soli TaxID=2798301 RepID=A0ABS1HCN2_9BACL|nr:YIP1 family protein [Viridibacillus soli]MBK3497197.1 YIP1 family protein [Viridibacillus soli]
MSEEIRMKNPSLLGMITRPTEQFERITASPKIWSALAIITLLSIIGTWLTSIGIDVESLEFLTVGEVRESKVFTIIGIIIGGLFFPIFTVLIFSFIYWVIAKIAHLEVSFRHLFSMNTYILIIPTLSSIVNGIIGLLIESEPNTLFTSLESLIVSKGTFGVFLNNMEIFKVWEVIITTIGLQKVANYSKGFAWTISIAFFVITIIFMIINFKLNGI